MRMLKIMGVLGTLGMLAGCVSDIENMRTVEPTGGTAFTQALTEEYRGLVTHEADEDYDWSAANHFADKGLAAANGEAVPPDEVGGVPDDAAGELTDARSQLMAALDGGARDSNPAVAARAQRAFDCWLHEATENLGEDHVAACRDEFRAAMTELQGAPVAASPGTYVILFDFDSAELNDAGQAVVNQILADIRARGGSVGVSATGHADRSGSEDYNLALSLRRADTVRAALIAGGVGADAITTAGRGESENAVPTADGVKEQANRRVEVILQ